MSLKGIELQIAIPKTFDAGKIAEQKQQQISIKSRPCKFSNRTQTLKIRETVLEAEEYCKDGCG